MDLEVKEADARTDLARENALGSFVGNGELWEPSQNTGTARRDEGNFDPIGRPVDIVGT